MANDIDMWNDIEELKAVGITDEGRDLFKCYAEKYINGNSSKADTQKEKFNKNMVTGVTGIDKEILICYIGGSNERYT